MDQHRTPDHDPTRGQRAHDAARFDGALAADSASDRLSRFAHELSGLIDGAIRYISLARAGVRTNPSRETDAAASRQLESAAAALERMAELIHAAMRPCSGDIERTLGGSRSLLDAAKHAADVVKPAADERGVTVSLNTSDGLDSTPSGALYTVLLNGVRNAVEACARGGRVDVHIGLFPRVGGGAEVRIDVLDDGVGPPRSPDARVFEPGYTTKPSGMGIGLALCREIIAKMGGEIDLLARTGAPDGRGAHLRVRCPVPGASGAPGASGNTAA